MRILIVGGGIAGLGLAVALQRHGIDPQLVERRPTAPPDGAAITLHANGVRMLDELGFGRDLEAASAPLPRWTFFDERGNRLCSTDLDELWHGVARCRGISRARLHAILDRDIDCRLGVAVTAIEPTEHDVGVGFGDGSAARYDLVVGADGIRSTVRRLVIDDRPPVTGALRTWRSVAPVRPDGVDHLLTFLGDGCFFGLVPVGDGATYGFAGLTEGEADEVFAEFPEPVTRFLAAATDVHSGRIADVEPRFTDGRRVVLIGDAAHAMPPHMGQGGSLALEDAVVLAELVGRSGDGSTVLREYAERRRKRIDGVGTQSHAAARAWSLPPAVRNAVLRERGDAILRERYEPLRERP